MIALSAWPRITIVTPNYNRAAYLDQTIMSVLTQGYPNLDYLVIDGGSTDGSVDIIRRYEQHLTAWVSEPDRGQAHAINKGFAMGTGDIIAWLNSDDYYLPGTLQFVGQQFRGTPGLEWLAGSVRQVDEQNQYLRTISTQPPSFLARERLFTNGAVFQHHIDQPAVFWTRRLWDAAGPLDESYDYCMDWKLWMQAFALGFEPRWVSPELTAFRVHALSKTEKGKALMNTELARVFREAAHKPGFRTLPNLKLWARSLRDVVLSMADDQIRYRHPLRAAALLSFAMLCTPVIIRRRLYTWRQIAQVVTSRE
jgi:glycosyltransferase involved in cell wall biosynthesis